MGPKSNFHQWVVRLSGSTEKSDGPPPNGSEPIHYWPLPPRFFAILVGFFFLVLILRAVRYAYESLGVSSNAAIFLLLATLIGSFFNIPITELPPEVERFDKMIGCEPYPTITLISSACVTPCLS
jgi:hypothetical protein